MSLLTTIVKIADSVTNSLKFQTYVTYRQWIGNETGYGDEKLNPAKKIRAVVEFKQQNVTTSAGTETVSKLSVLFIDLPALMKATNNAGLSVQDFIQLPDGTTGPILSLDGFVDPSIGVGAAKGKMVYTQVYM
jgi:hypothetical protein